MFLMPVQDVGGLKKYTTTTLLLSSSSFSNGYKILPMYNMEARTATAFLSRGDFDRPRLHRQTVLPQ